MVEPVTLTMSALALAVSMFTAWRTFLQRGTIKMTRPTLIYFNADLSDREIDKYTPKVYLRTLLFATSKRGRIVENLYVTVTHKETQYNFRNETRCNFNVWVYGEREKLVRGSGLFVGETGVEANHHFLPAPDTRTTLFAEGRYRVEVFAHLLGDKRQRLLLSQSLLITQELARQLQNRDAGLRFDWAPDSSNYVAHVDWHPPQ